MSNNTVKSQDTAEVTAMKAQIEAMKLEQAKLMAQLQAKRGSTLSFKLSEKGAVSVYGMGKFPVTLYGEQWERLLADETVTSLKAFLADNAEKLSKKVKATPAAPVVGKPDPAVTYRTGDGQTSHKAV